MIKFPTSNSWWIFDDTHLRFRKIPRDMNPDAFVLDGDWQKYADLEIDADNSAFTVFLDEEKTRLLRGYIESADSEQDLDKDIVASDA
ncbi:MAG TPA: hypothetical protein PKB15_00320 [Acidimicrobiia bacterium]|jgi:hypothetical protein|nr:hypothetical protein [Acidimicrobiia bacterium]